MSSQFVALPNLKPLDAKVVALYGSDFLNDVCPKFPSMNREATYPTLTSAVDDTNAPSLVSVDNIYGKGASIMWLKVQITEMLMYTGLRSKMTDYQQTALARQLRKMAYHVKLSEMMQFFTRFEQGYYKTFHGYERPNPQIVTESFNLFLNDLLEVRIRQQEKEEEERRRLANEQKSTPEFVQKIAERLKRLDRKFNVRLSKESESEV